MFALARRTAVVAAALALAAAPLPAHATLKPTWAATGPHKVAVRVGSVTTLYYPADIASSRSRHPVIIWGNGTFAVPAIYGGLLRHWASHGFIVAAANTTQSFTAAQMLAGLQTLRELDGRPGAFRGKVDLQRVGASGHSQGGAGAINAGGDPRVRTTVAIQPGPITNAARLRGPLLQLVGQRDHIVPPSGWVRGIYARAAHVPTVHAELAGANHFTGIGAAGGFRGASTAWFRHHLMDDPRARGEFFGAQCGICTDSAWSDVRRNAKALA